MMMDQQHTMRESSATSSSSKKAMEASTVLSKYLDLFNNDCNQFKYYMASNSVVDWFGRSVRGPMKIHDYFRHEICSQYDHINFEKAEDCDPIETKPVHIKTMSSSKREIDYIHPKNRVGSITSLRNRAESDVEDDEDDTLMEGDVEMKMVGHRTPEKQQCLSVEDQLTPPASTNKVMSPQEGEELINSEDTLKQHRMYSKSFSYLRRFPATNAGLAKKRRLCQEEGIRTLLDESSASETEEEDTSESAYSALHYVETLGTLRFKNNSSSHNRVGGRISPNSSFSSQVQSNNANWDRQVRIRISYRQRLSDNQLQFALIVYEHIGGGGVSARAQASRRNLMSEFGRSSEDGPNEIIISSRPVVVLGNEETTVATVTSATPPSTAEITTALESAVFTIVPLHTPTKHAHTPPATPKRKSRLHNSASSSSAASAQKRLNFSPSSGTPKRSAARSLRL